MFNNYGNDVNIPVEKPVVQQIIDVAGNLPDTGPTGYVLIVGLVALSAYFFVRNKQLTHELAAATVEYQHQESAQSFSEMQNVIHPEPEAEEPADDGTTPPPAAGAPQV